MVHRSAHRASKHRVRYHDACGCNQPVAGYVYRNLTLLAGTAADPAPDVALRNRVSGLNYNEIQIAAMTRIISSKRVRFDYYASSWW